MVEGAQTPVTVGWIKKQLACFPDDKLVQFTTLCFDPGTIPETIDHCFIGGGYRDNPVSFDLCDKVVD